MEATKVVEVGASVGVLLPESTLERLGVKLGDMVYLVNTPAGVLLTSSLELKQQLDAAHNVMDRHRQALKALAK